MNTVGAIDLSQLEFVGHDLHRPECVLCTHGGTVYVSDWRGGVTRIDPDGAQAGYVDLSHGDELKPNGIALLSDGSFLLANLGTAGGVWRLTRDGIARPWLAELGGERLPPCNYVMLDRFGRIWVTVSTTREPRQRGYRPDVDDGFIVLVQDGETRVVADGLGYTNEVQLHPSGDWLYVNETFGRRLSRFPVLPDGSLGEPGIVARFGHGMFPDGMAFDEEGGVWITSLVSNRVIRCADGALETVIEDTDTDHVEWVEEAFLSGTMDRPHFDTMTSKLLKNTSSIAFGGPDLRTAYIGCLLDGRIARFEAPVAGVPPVHWDWE